MVLARVLYAVLVIVGIIDLFLVAPAILSAPSRQVVGRLLSTLLVLTGIVLASGSRALIVPPVNPVVLVGLILMDSGLVGYALFLPDRGVLGVIAHHRDRRRA